MSLKSHVPSRLRCWLYNEVSEICQFCYWKKELGTMSKLDKCQPLLAERVQRGKKLACLKGQLPRLLIKIFNVIFMIMLYMHVHFFYLNTLFCCSNVLLYTVTVSVKALFSLEFSQTFQAYKILVMQLQWEVCKFTICKSNIIASKFMHGLQQM